MIGEYMDKILRVNLTTKAISHEKLKTFGLNAIKSVAQCSQPSDWNPF